MLRSLKYVNIFHPLEWLILLCIIIGIAFLFGGCFRICVDKIPGEPPAVSGTVTLPATITINQTQPATLPH